MRCAYLIAILLVLVVPARGQDFEIQALETLEHRGVNFYEKADKLTGIASCLTAALSRIDPFGYFIEAREIAMIRQDFALFLQYGPALVVFGLTGLRRDDGWYRGMVADSADAMPSGGCFKAVPALKADLIGLDNGLARREISLRAWLRREEQAAGYESYRRHVNARIKAIQLLRSLIGAPSKAQSQ